MPDEERSSCSKGGVSMNATITYFEETGPTNTTAVLALVKKRAAEAGVKRIVLASTRGDTTREANQAFSGTDVKLVVIPHQRGFRETNQFDMDLARSWSAPGIACTGRRCCSTPATSTALLRRRLWPTYSAPLAKA